MSPNKIDTQQHLLECEKLQFDNVLVIGGPVPIYEDLFGKDVKKIIKIGLILSQNFSRRQQLLNKTAKQSM